MISEDAASPMIAFEAPEQTDRPLKSEALLRGRQLRAMEINVDRGLKGLLIVVLITTALFYNSWRWIALSWCAMAVLVCGLRLAVTRRALSREISPLSPRALRPYLAWAVIVAVAAMWFPVWVAMLSDGLQFAYMMTLTLGIFWSASFVHAPVMSSARAFMAAQLAVGVVAALLAGASLTQLGLAALFIMGAGSALVLVSEHSQLFRSSLLQQLELKEKADTIAFILDEFQDQSSDILWEIDSRLAFVNPSAKFAQLLNRSVEQLETNGVTEMVADPKNGSGENVLRPLRALMKDRAVIRDLVLEVMVEGRPKVLKVSGRPIFDTDGAFSGYTGVVADVTAAKLAEARIHHLASHDALTDLRNYASIRDRLENLIESGEGFCLLSLDLDGFGDVNERYGHTIGDRVLLETADRLRALSGHDAGLARTGSDEFLIQISAVPLAEIESFSRRVIAALSAPIDTDESEVVVGASIGIALAPEDGASGEDIIRAAEAARQRARQEDRGGFRFFAEELDLKQQARRRMLQDLRQAVTNDEFSLHYQPLISCRSAQAVACEALLRWEHPEHGVVSPADFVPLLEEIGLIGAVGDWVIAQACREAAEWAGDIRVSVNVSPIQLRDRELPHKILAALHESGLSPDRLEIELTETALVDDVQSAVDLLRRIKALGVRLALDDFGTGHSSLSYLRLFPFDKVKIDQSFVRLLPTSEENRVIVKAICDIAAGLKMSVTAEGVETEEQVRELRLVQCDEFQGYLFGRPQPSHALGGMIRRRAAA